MDELDGQIIGELQEAYSLTPKVTDIAKKLKKSSTTVHSRIKKLEREGVITGYKATIDPERINKKLSAFYFIKTDRGKEAYLADTIAKELLKNKNVKNVYNTMGEWDLMIEFVGKDSNDYIKFMKETEPLHGIKETKGKYILKTYSSKFKLLPD